LKIWASNENCGNEAIKVLFKNIQQKGVNRNVVELSNLKEKTEEKRRATYNE